MRLGDYFPFLTNARRFIDIKEAIVFGSVIKGKVMGASDLDIALVVRNLNKREISKLLIQIHLSLPEEISEVLDITIIDEKDESDFLKFAGKYVIVK
ncbi:MAG: nucleotidyltransferase domain-containing protein [Caldivirga sp.]|uniref:nucleotidyltransferase domain-containing protein n=2 Tax=Caldivirga sp. TaxID=2080243 RepID=UPI003D0AEF06